MKAFPKTFAIIDTETTGMRPGFARLTDIGIIRIENGKEVRRFETLLNPGMTIPSMITGFTGITNEMVQDAPAFEDVALEVREMLEGAIFVAHNAAFDYGFMKAEFAHTHMEFDAETLCSVQLSRALFPKERSHSLDSVIARHGIVCESRHRAMPDAQAVWDFFKHIDRTLDPDLVARAVAHVRAGYSTTKRTGYTDLPDSAGVYFFYGPEQELLYIGKSKHVRTRVRSHFRGGISNKEQRIQTDTTSVETIPTSGELSALLLESALIKRESPLFNRMLRKRKMLVIAKKIIDENGFARVSLERTADIVPDGSVLSVFRTTTQGKGVLRTLAGDHGICERLLGSETGTGPCFGTQIGKCDGACMGKVDARVHNERIDEAFKARKIRTWPYSGTVMIREAENEGKGTVFFIDNWVLLGAFRYEEEGFAPLIDAQKGFEYDTYKILARYMRKRENKRAIEALSEGEFRKLFAQCTNSYDAAIN